MRWLLAGFLAMSLASLALLASPYLAAGSLMAAIERGDAGAVAERVNFRALRQSIARHLASEIGSGPRTGTIPGSGGDTQMVAAAIAAAADPLLEQVLTADGLVTLLRRREREGAPAAATPRRQGSTFDQIPAFLSSSSWRGFRNVYFFVPPEGPRTSRFRLQLRLSRLSWRLVGIELPEDMRRRLVRQILRRPAPAP